MFLTSERDPQVIYGKIYFVLYSFVLQSQDFSNTNTAKPAM